MKSIDPTPLQARPSPAVVNKAIDILPTSITTPNTAAWDVQLLIKFKHGSWKEVVGYGGFGALALWMELVTAVLTLVSGSKPLFLAPIAREPLVIDF